MSYGVSFGTGIHNLTLYSSLSYHSSSSSCTEHKLYGAFAKDVDMTKKATKIVFAASDDEEDS